jgi:hypothetical protein
MLANTLTITYNAVSVTLTRATEANYQSSYFGENAGNKFTLEIKHIVPARGSAGEAHTAKLTVEYFDANGVYLRSESAWQTIKTFDQSQNSVTVSRTAKALSGLMTSAFVDQLVARES